MIPTMFSKAPPPQMGVSRPRARVLDASGDHVPGSELQSSHKRPMVTTGHPIVKHPKLDLGNQVLTPQVSPEVPRNYAVAAGRYPRTDSKGLSAPAPTAMTNAAAFPARGAPTSLAGGGVRSISNPSATPSLRLQPTSPGSCEQHDRAQPPDDAASAASCLAGLADVISGMPRLQQQAPQPRAREFVPVTSATVPYANMVPYFQANARSLQTSVSRWGMLANNATHHALEPVEARQLLLDTTFRPGVRHRQITACVYTGSSDPAARVLRVR
jgi:hypothetical protein|eukprot:COSAG01_NODE_242_length_20582_cov_314.397256_20_plen_271_part_00